MIIEQTLPEIGLGAPPQPLENPLERTHSERFGETFHVKGNRSGVTFRSARRGMNRSGATNARTPTELMAEFLSIARPVMYCKQQLPCRTELSPAVCMLQ